MSKPLKEDYIIRIKSRIEQRLDEPAAAEEKEEFVELMTRGIHLTSRIVPGGTHSEASWEKQLPFVFHTLLYEVE